MPLGDYLRDLRTSRQKFFLCGTGFLYSECPCDETARYVGEEGSTQHHGWMNEPLRFTAGHRCNAQRCEREAQKATAEVREHLSRLTK
jgi:hypothetical protein